MIFRNKNNTLFSSGRLNFREWTLKDASFLYGLNSDPEVLKFTGDSPFKSITATEEFISAYTHYKDHGYGRWLCTLASTSEPIGWAGLKNQLSEEGIIDIGFRFSKKFWNQGYATEAARACLKTGFERFHIEKITGRAAVENVYSGKTLEKVGMTKLPFTKTLCGQETAFYELTHKEFHLLQ